MVEDLRVHVRESELDLEGQGSVEDLSRGTASSMEAGMREQE